MNKASSGCFALVHSGAEVIAPANEEQNIDVETIQRPLHVLAMTIAKNAGVERLLIVKKIMQSSSAAGYAQCWVIFLKREGKGIIKPA